MFGLNRESISTKRICDGWRELKVERCGVRLEGSFKTKQQMTVELTSPFVESITIETTEPFANPTDLANFAEELALVVEHRRRVRRKQKLVDNKELLHTKILPLWFEREAFVARNSAEKEDIRKAARRELNAGKMELKEYNALVCALRGRCDDDDFIGGLDGYNRRLTTALGVLDIEKGFRLTQQDLRVLFGRKAWEETLQICELNKEVKDSTLHIIARGVENFNRLYNLDPQTIRLGQMRREYDAITTAGFGDIILAAALKKNGVIWLLITCKVVEHCAILLVQSSLARFCQNEPTMPLCAMSVYLWRMLLQQIVSNTK